MRRYYLSAFAALMATLCFTLPSSAQHISLAGCDRDVHCDGKLDCAGHGAGGAAIGCESVVDGTVCDACDAICGSCCDGASGGLYAEAELLLFKYTRADGVRVGADDGEEVFGNYKATPRFTLGWISANGLGARLRYFQFDQGLQTNNGGIENVGIDTFTIDLEVFEKICLNKNWTIELSGGLRYNEFDELMVDSIAPFGPNDIAGEFRLNAFDGWGGVLGLQANRKIGRYTSVFGRMRGAILVDDKFVANSFGFPQPVFADSENLTDTTVGMIEIAIGYEYNRVLRNNSLLFARCGFEWQNWYNYSSSFAGPLDTDDVFLSLGESIFTGPSDVGFYGLTFSIGIEM